jgi:CheY-like chemotaxis protein
VGPDLTVVSPRPRRLVLIVDDDADIRDGLTDALEHHGYDAIHASNGAEALAKLQAGIHPDVILLDIMMPVMDGWAFRAAQRHDPAIADIPVVILSAHALARGAAFEMGVAAFLNKPVRLEALLATLRRHLGGPPVPAAAPLG